MIIFHILPFTLKIQQKKQFDGKRIWVKDMLLRASPRATLYLRFTEPYI